MDRFRKGDRVIIIGKSLECLIAYTGDVFRNETVTGVILNDAQKDKIRNFFLEDNIKLQKLLNKDLSGSIYNYT